MKRIFLRFLIFIITGSMIYGSLLLLSQVKPFKIESLLPAGHPVRVSYERYLKKFDDERTVFILVENKTKAFSPQQIETITQNLTKELKHTNFLNSVVSLNTARYLSKKNNSYQIRPLISDQKMSPDFDQEIKDPFWDRLLIAHDKKALLLSFKISKKLKRENEAAYMAKLIKNINSRLPNAPNIKAYFFGVKVANLYFTKEMNLNQNIITPILLLLIGLFILFYFRSFKILLTSYLVLVLSYTSLIIIIVLREGGIGPYSIYSLSFVFIVCTSDLIHFYSKFMDTTASSLKERLLEVQRSIIKPCFLTTLTTSLGFISLMFNDVLPIQNFGLYCSLGSLICFLLTFFFIPWFLCLFEWNIKHAIYLRGLPSKKISTFIKQYSRSIIFIFLGFFLFLCYQSTSIHLDDNLYEKFRHYHPMTKSVERFKEKFQLAGTIDILISSKQKPTSIMSYTNKAEIEAFERDIRKISNVSYVRSVNQTSQYIKNKGFTVHLKELLSLLSDFGGLDDFYNNHTQSSRTIVFLRSMSSQQLKETINNVKSITAKHLENYHTEISGFSAVRNFINTRSTINFLRSFGFSIILIILTFLIIFRSFKVACLAIIPNIYPLLLISGLMGFFKVPIDSNLVILCCITIGIAVDDTIHFIFHLNEERKKHSLERSIQNAIDKTGKALIGTTLIFAFCFPCFFLSDLKLFFQVGSFLLLSLFMALICDFVLLPAILFSLNNKHLRKTGKNL